MANVQSEQADLKNSMMRILRLVEAKETKSSKLELESNSKLHITYIVQLNMKLMPTLDESDPMWLEIPKISNYFKECHAELTAMKKKSFPGTSVNYYSLLTEPFYVLDHHARNSHIVEEFKHTDYKSYYKIYPIYGFDVWLRFKAALAGRMAREQGNVNKLKVFFRERFTKYEDPSNAVRQLAMTEAEMNETVFTEQELLNEFKRFEIKPEMFNYYKQCKLELTAMKNRKFKDTLITYFAFLTKPEDVLVGYVRNEQTRKEFDSKEYETLYPIYGSSLRMYFDEAVATHKWIEKVSTILCATFQRAELTDKLLTSVCQYLTNEDTEQIVSSA